MIIKHNRFKDVCFETFAQEDNFYVGRWINMGYTKSWYLPCVTEAIEIVDRKEWEKCTNPTKVVCLRNGNWMAL